MIIARKGIDRDCDCKKNFIQRIEELITRAWNCVNKINNITPDGDNNFNIVGSENISVTPEGNGVKIALSGSSGVASVNNKTGNVILESNDSAINVTDNGNSVIGVELADWVFDEMGQFTTDINGLKDDVLNLQNESKIKTINNISPDASNNFGISASDLVQIYPQPNSIRIGTPDTYMKQFNKIPTIESNLTTVAGQTETNRQNIVTLQNETKVKKVNNINPDTSGNFTISAGSNITLTPTTNGLEISSSGGGASSDWTRWSGGNNWVNANLFNSSRIALKDILINFNASVSGISNLFLKGQLYIPKGCPLDLMASMVLDTYGLWCNDKIVHSSYLSTDTTDIYNSLSGNTMKVYLNYRQIDSNNAIGNLTATNVQLNKSNGTTLYYK